MPNIGAVCGALQTSKGCAAAEEIKASETGGVGRDSVALAETCRGRPSVTLARELVEVGLAGPLRQLRVEGVEDLAHGHGSCARGARGVEGAARYARNLKDKVGCARRDCGLVHRVGVAGRVEARRRRGLNNVIVQLGWLVAGIDEYLTQYGIPGTLRAHGRCGQRI